MTIKIEITGNHATDIIAEVQTLAEIFGVGGTTVPTPEKVADSPKPSEKETVPSGTATEPQKLNRKEQDEAVSEMIAAGAKDQRFDLLTKGRQNEVEAALTKKNEPQTEETDVDDMFNEEVEEQIITREMVSRLMGDTCKNPDGTTIQEKAIMLRKILVDAIPEGEDIKVVNIPDGKLKDVYAAIQKVGA